MLITALSRPEGHCFIVLGSNGLVGSSVLSSLSCSNHSAGPTIARHIGNDPESISECLKKISTESLVRESKMIHILFACGRGGFGISCTDRERQLDLLIRVLSACEELWKNRFRFFSVSSLGAHLSTHASEYKLLVDASEKVMLQHAYCRIIRLPSIWGLRGEACSPKGLIGHLLVSAKQRKESLIYADLNTTRNYLSARTTGLLVSQLMHSLPDSVGCKVVNLRSISFLTVAGAIGAVRRATGRIPLFRVVEGELADRDHHLTVPRGGSELIGLECLESEIKAAWRTLLHQCR